MTKPTDLADLSRLAALAHAATESQMSALRQREADLRAMLAELDAARRDRASGAAEDDAALRAGQDLLWHRWIDSRRQALNGELAKVLASQAQLRAELSRSFGRKEAIETLRRDAVRDLQTLRDRRAGT